MNLLTQALDEENKLLQQEPPHLIVIARAGTGKSSTIIEGIKPLVYQRRSPEFVPSDQQQEIWTELEKTPKGAKIALTSFANSIVQDLKSKAPSGVPCETLHHFGKLAIHSQHYSAQLDPDKVTKLIAYYCGVNEFVLRKKMPEFLQATQDLVNYARYFLLFDWHPHCLEPLLYRHNIEYPDSKVVQVCETASKILKDCYDFDRQESITYDFVDMIWLPVVKKYPLKTFDLLCIDEAQDLNRAQQAMALTMGKRLVCIGDDRQAIYAFAGADHTSLYNLENNLKYSPKGCITKRLTVTRRCSKRIVAHAQNLVRDIQAREDSPEGEVGCIKKGELISKLQPGDFVICRANAPLIGICMEMISKGVQAKIIGRDIASNLASTIDMIHALGGDFLEQLENYFSQAIEKEEAKEKPSPRKIDALLDRRSIVRQLYQTHKGAKEAKDYLFKLFANAKDEAQVKLMTVHKSKGLEAERVFVINTKDSSIPAYWAKSLIQKSQERNLLYVAITRARNSLFFVED